MQFLKRCPTCWEQNREGKKIYSILLGGNKKELDGFFQAVQVSSWSGVAKYYLFIGVEK